jgi:hypothetical protein
MSNRWRLMIVVATAAFVPRGAVAQRRPPIGALDALMKRYWISAVAGDSAALNAVIIGEQPRLVLGAFIGGSGEVTRMDAEQIIARRHPPMRSLGDTVWRTYVCELATCRTVGSTMWHASSDGVGDGASRRYRAWKDRADAAT